MTLISQAAFIWQNYQGQVESRISRTVHVYTRIVDKSGDQTEKQNGIGNNVRNKAKREIYCGPPKPPKKSSTKMLDIVQKIIRVFY